MKSTILKYGLIAGGIMVLLFTIPYLIWGEWDPDNMAMGEIIGYSTMILTMLLVILGMKSYRDNQPGAKLTYMQGVGIGSGISAIAGVIFGIFSYILYKFVMPDFIYKYMDYLKAQIRNSGASADEISRQIADLEAQSSFYSNILLQSGIMFLTVFLIGLIITLIAAAFLRSAKTTAVASTDINR